MAFWFELRLWNLYFVLKIVLIYCEKKNVLVIETKLLGIQNLGYLYKKIVITRTVLSNCEGQNDIGIREYFTSLVTGGF